MAERKAFVMGKVAGSRDLLDDSEVLALLQPGAELASGGQPESSLALATERQIEVVKLAAEGMSTGQIAERLTLDPGAVKEALKRVEEKLAGVADDQDEEPTA